MGDDIRSWIDVWAMIFVVGSMYGAMLYHRLGVLITGDTGGLYSSKRASVMNREMVSLITGVPASSLPRSASYIELIAEGLGSDELKIGSTLRCAPVVFFDIGRFFAWIWITSGLFRGYGDFVAAILWLILSIIIFERRITGFLPNHIPEESIDGIDEADYKRIRRKILDKSSTKRPRLKK